MPKEEQQKLFFVTSTLFFGFKAIDEIVKENLLSAKTKIPQGNNLKNIFHSLFGINAANAQNFNNGTDWFDDDCSGGQLLSVWSIALAEPTPIGEVIATAVTIYIGAVLVAELVTECYESDVISTPYIDINYCIDLYVQCTDVTPKDDCSTCLNYCGTQGEWPYQLCPLLNFD